jgi:hypothetical protein
MRGFSHSPRMKRPLVTAVAVLGGLACAGAGWVARGLAAEHSCRYTANGYGRLYGNLNRLPPYPLEKVPDEVVGGIQKCWAAHPYNGPQQSLNIIGAVKAPAGGYYLVFEPWNLTDIEIVFRVDGRGRVSRAFAYGTL